jgi:hypothetical protein
MPARRFLCRRHIERPLIAGGARLHASPTATKASLRAASTTRTLHERCGGAHPRVQCSAAESATRRLGQCSRGAVCLCAVGLRCWDADIPSNLRTATPNARTAIPNLRAAVGWDRQVLQYADMTSTLPEHERSFPLGGVRGHSRDGSASVSSHVRCPIVALWRNDRIRAHGTLRHTKDSRAAHAHARTRAKASGIAACTSKSKKGRVNADLPILR